jgi:hypothetical protein
LPNNFKKLKLKIAKLLFECDNNCKRGVESIVKRGLLAVVVAKRRDRKEIILSLSSRF